MNILFSTNDFKPNDGGIAEHTDQMATALSKRGHTVTVLTHNMRGAAEFDGNAQYSVIRIPALPSLLRFLAYVLYSLYYSYKLSADWIHCPVWFPNGVASILSKFFFDVKIAITIHGREVTYNKGSKRPYIKIPVQNMAFSYVDIVFGVSRYTTRVVDIIANSNDAIMTLTNGVAASEFSQAKPLECIPGVPGEGSNVVLTVSRLVERKGHDKSLVAVSQLLEKNPDTYYVIAGDGDKRRELENMAISLGIEDNVVFLGYVEDDKLPRLYASADVFLMPNRRVGSSIEGFGIVFLEANAAGIPVVGGRSGGVEDAIEHGETGFLIDPTDPEDIHQKVHDLLTDPQLSQRMGSAGRERVHNRFKWGQIAARMEEKMMER